VTPTVVGLHLSKAAAQPLESVTWAQAVEERGLTGDRHDKPKSKRAVLLMEQEVLDLFQLPPGAVREQVTVRGLSLMTLAPGTRLRVGGTLLEVTHACDPCELMNTIKPGLQQELEGRRGRFVRVVESGSFAVGDAITVLPPA
jgi:MOSC domain-containing protein YiiM